MAKTSESKCFIPLTNFESEPGSIQLAPGYAVRETPETVRQIMKNYFAQWPKIAYGDFVLQCTSTQEALKRDVTLWEGCAERAVSVLRLCKEGIVGYNVVVPIPQVKTRHSIVLCRRPWVSADVLESQAKYRIRQDEVQKLQKFFVEFIAARLGDLDLAAEYFNKSYEEIHTPRDSFVDLIIALESLYLKGENLELGYKLRMRMSHLLSRHAGDRKRIYDNMKKAYQLRSDIIHGEKHPNIDPAMLLEIREYARKSLQVFIRNPVLRNNLDKLVLEAGTNMREKK